MGDRSKCLNRGLFRRRQRQQDTNPAPILFATLPILDQSANPMSILDQCTDLSANLWPIVGQPLNSVSILCQSDNTSICQSWTKRQILHQFINSCQLRQLLHIIKALVKSSKTPTNQTTFPIGHRLAKSAPIPDQSENSCACKRGTRILCGPTEVSPRWTISHTVVTLAPLHWKIQRQSSKSMQIQDQSAIPSSHQSTIFFANHCNLWPIQEQSKNQMQSSSSTNPPVHC